ncbi:MAG: hypothetical protein ABWK01_06115 [Infirmifilum sp.]
MTDGLIKLSDGSILRLRILIVDVKEVGFSPFAGVNFDVKAIGGIATQFVPEDLRESVKNKPIVPPFESLPTEGWEIIDIVESQPAAAEEDVVSSKGKFKVKVVADPVMVSRNTNYKTPSNEPLYWVSWVWKISWKPIKE